MSLSRCLMAGALAVASLGAAGDGTLTVNGKTFKLTHAYATTRQDSFDKKKTDVLLLFTDVEMPANVLEDEFGVMEVLNKTPFNGVDAKIDPDKEVVSGDVYSTALKKINYFSANGMQNAEITAWTPSRIAGKLYMEKPDDFFENIYQYSITFDVPIVTAAQMKKAAPPPPGKPLPADGGEPRKAYDDYRKIVAKGDLGALRNVVSSDRAKSIDDPDFKKMFPLIQQMEPKNVKYVSGTVDGDKAILNVTAKDGSETSTGTVTMMRQGGKWKVDNEAWKSKME